ncbi:MAG: hypothetical protein AAFX87_23800 [Bacteroidota bacterium]
MESLKEIIYNLKPSEAEFIQDYYKVKRGGLCSKRLKLFQLVHTRKVKTDEEAAKVIYKTRPTSTFSKLKKRLKEDILNFLIMMSGDKTCESASTGFDLQARKLIIQGKILMSRGLYEEAAETTQKALKIADTYELIDLKINACDMLRSTSENNQPSQQHASINAKIKQTMSDQQYLQQAKAYSYLLAHEGVANQDIDADALKELEEVEERSESAKVSYWCLKTACQYHYANRNYVEARDSAMRLIDMVEHEKAIHSDYNLCEAHFLLTKSLICLKQYEEAIVHAGQSLGATDAGLLCEEGARSAQFLSSYYHRDLKLANAVIKEVLINREIKLCARAEAKWTYYEACLLFARKDFNGSLKSLYSNSGLLKEKTCGTLGYRLLEILNMVEMKEYDWLDFKLENHRKLLQRFKGNEYLRYKITHRIITTLATNGFNFNKTYQQEYDKLTMLKSEAKPYLRDPLGFELIDFNGWFNQKVGLS